MGGCRNAQQWVDKSIRQLVTGVGSEVPCSHGLWLSVQCLQPRILPQGRQEMPYRESQATGVKSSLCFVWKISVLVRSSRMESGWRGVAMAKRASGDLFNAFFCCPRRNFKCPQKFKALEGIRKCACENRVMATGCAPAPMGHEQPLGDTLGGRGVSWCRAMLPEIPRSYPASSGSGR